MMTTDTVGISKLDEAVLEWGWMCFMCWFSMGLTTLKLVYKQG